MLLLLVGANPLPHCRNTLIVEFLRVYTCTGFAKSLNFFGAANFLDTCDGAIHRFDTVWRSLTDSSTWPDFRVNRSETLFVVRLNSLE